MNNSTTVKIWKKTRRLLRLISAYEDKPMTAILHEMAGDRLQKVKPEGKPLSEVLFEKDDEDNKNNIKKPVFKINDTPAEGFRR